MEVEEFLEHFGVKGMRWGVRKERKESKIFNNRRIGLEAKYVKKGASLDEAKVRADRRIKTEKILAVVGGVAVASLAAYGTKQAIGKRFVGVVLDKDTDLKYINALGNKADFNRRLYTTFKEGDTKKYRGLLAKQLQRNAPNTKVYETVLRSTDKIKAPSHFQAKRVYDHMKRTFPEFRDSVGKLSYKEFNRELVDESWKPGHIFYKEMTRRGYNAILDSNDQFISGYNAKKPLILFNAASATVKKGQSVVDKNTINGLYKRQMAGVLTRSFVPTAGVGAAAMALPKGIETNSKYSTLNKYLMENPRSREDPAVIFSRMKMNKDGTYSIPKK